MVRGEPGGGESLQGSFNVSGDERGRIAQAGPVSRLAS